MEGGEHAGGAQRCGNCWGSRAPGSGSLSTDWRVKIGVWSSWPGPMKTADGLCGVGPMISTALVAKVGNARQFAVAASWPPTCTWCTGEHSSGGKRGPRGMTKRGDRYLRTLLIHGGAGRLLSQPRQVRPALALGAATGRSAEGATWRSWRWHTKTFASPGPCSAALRPTVYPPPRRRRRYDSPLNCVRDPRVLVRI
jgi:hypothetical protein